MERSSPPRGRCAVVTSLLLALVVVGSLATRAQAVFTVVDLHPAGATSSVANGIRNGQKVGRVDGNTAIWNSVNAVNTSLGSGVLYGTDGVQQVGHQGAAAVWSGTAGSKIDLSPNPPLPNQIDSVGLGVFAGFQVGYALRNPSGLAFHAILWGSSGSGYIDLNPNLAGAQSIAYGEYNGQQAGTYLHSGISAQHAIVWFSNPNAFTDLNPAGSTESEALAVYNGRQGGYARFGGIKHGGTWNNTAASWNDLHPVGASESTVNGVDNGAGANVQAGYASFAGVDHAAYWAGTAGSFEDLHTYLPAGYTHSRATGVWVNGSGFALVTGWAYNLNGQPEAKLWVQQVPEPGSLGLILGAGVLALRRRLPQ